MTAKRLLRDVYLAVRAVPLKVIGAFTKKQRPGGIVPRSILAVRIDRIGDLIVSLPALKALRQSFPEASLTVLAAEKNVLLLKIFPWIDEVIAYKGFISTVRILRKRRFSLAIDLLMDYTLKTALLTVFSGSRFTAGFDIAARGSFFDIKVPSAGRIKHVSLYMLDLAGMVADFFGLHLDKDVDVDFSIPAEERAFAGSLIKKSGADKGSILIGIHPGGHYESQRWPIESFARLADIAVKEFGAKVLIIGSAEENMLVDTMAGMMKEAPIKIIGLSLNMLAAVIAELDLFICNNSGPWHIACVLGIPTVSTMGPTDHNIWSPIKGEHVVIRKELSCSPCDLAVCRRHDCMKTISVSDMAEGLRAQACKMKLSGGKKDAD